MVHSILGIEDIVVDNEGCALMSALTALSNLPDASIFSKDVIKLLGCDLVRQISDEENPIHLRRQPNVGLMSGHIISE